MRIYNAELKKPQTKSINQLEKQYKSRSGEGLIFQSFLVTTGERINYAIHLKKNAFHMSSVIQRRI